MPPTRPIAPPPPTVPTPQTQTPAMLNPDSLSSAEELLLSVAIRINSAVREFQRRGRRVNVPFFQKSLDEELLEASTIFTSSLADKADPRLHSIITYVGELSEQAEARHTPLDLGAIRLSEVARRCGMAATACPTWPQELFISDLTPLLAVCLWSIGGGFHHCQVAPQRQRMIRVIHPFLQHVAYRSNSETFTEMAAASDAARTPPNLPPSSLPLQSHPPQMKMFRCRRRMGVTPPPSDEGWEAFSGRTTQPGEQEGNAYALTMRRMPECKDLPGKATACASCAAHKVKCDRTKLLAMFPLLQRAKPGGVLHWKRLRIRGKPWRRCKTIMPNSGGQHLSPSSCPTPIPQAPPLYESPAANPSSASIESAASSTSSSLHLNMLTIDSPTASTGVQPVAGSPNSHLEPDNAAGLGRGVEEQLRLLPGLQVQLHHAGVLAPAVEVVQ
ncbi:hypothetical protein EI94DRAFT_1820837 [Lactarius quietus]|nr:hypothetical protein EI94DRAFT_1820837 [Lactarius quietus]